MIHSITIRNPGFKDIKNGFKKIEGRLNKGIFKSLKIGDQIKFINYNSSILSTIINIKYYKTFNEMLQQENLNLIRPDAKSINDSLELYKKYYSKEDEEKYKVIAIFLE